MTLRRRLEMVFGGPARPFDLTVREADLLASACAAYLDERRTNRLPPDAPDAPQRRLYVFAGFDRTAERVGK